MEPRQFDLTPVKNNKNLLDGALLVGIVLFLVLLPFHLVIKKLVPDPIGSYWKEALLAFLVVLWFIRSASTRKIPRPTSSLDWAVLIYLLMFLIRALIDRAGMSTAWGLYISILYLPLVWLVPAVLRRSPSWLVTLTWLLTVTGGIVALGGILEFGLNRSLWPSIELTQRQGFPDVFVYGTQLRRVYFVFDSPTTLANTLAMLLPLAISLILLPSKLWARIAAGFSAVLMTVCIVVTFSRGIWIAAAIGLVFMAVQTGFVARYRRPLIIMIGILALSVLAWGIFFAPRLIQPTLSDQGIIEMPAQNFQALQAQVVLQMDQIEPVHGTAELQNWILDDPIEKRMDERTVIFQHPPESGKVEIIYEIDVPENAALKFALALSPEVWDPEKGDGASFELYITPTDLADQEQVVFNRYINPKINPSDRRWRNYLVSLKPWVGKQIRLSLVTQSGPVGDWAYDWAGWSNMQLVQVNQDIFTQSGQKGSNLLPRIVNSIVDWTGDETNRDRVAAWNMSLNAWLKNPLWGAGLGSTGVAALRTSPENAFVTESQVLKALTELGIPGLLTLLYLWYGIFRTGFDANRRQDMTPTQRAIFYGLCTGLVVVFIESLVYQNLEVKQVNAFFWTFVGMLKYLSHSQDV